MWLGPVRCSQLGPDSRHRLRSESRQPSTPCGQKGCSNVGFKSNCDHQPPLPPEIGMGLQCQELSLVTSICPCARVSSPVSFYSFLPRTQPPRCMTTAAAPGSFKTDLRWWPPEMVLGGYKDSDFWRNTAQSV